MNILKRTVKLSDAFDENVTIIETSVHPPELHTFPNKYFRHWMKYWDKKYTSMNASPIHYFLMFLTSGMLATLSYPFLKKKISPKKNLARCWPQEYQSLLLITKEEMEASMSSLKLFLCTISTWEEWMCWNSRLII